MNAIPPKQRVIVTVIKEPLTAKLLSGRSFTIPIVVFLSTMVVVFGLALVLENMRPRVRAVAGEERRAPASGPARLSA